MKKFLSFIFCLALGCFMKAQGANFLYYGTEQGLPQSGVQNIVQDKYGNLWFGTMAGVCRYDGVRYKTYTKKDGLAENWITASYIDKNGNIWFGHWAGGISVYNPVKNKIQTVAVHGIPLYKSITSILEDKSGVFWFGTEGSGILKWLPAGQFTEIDSATVAKGKFVLLSTVDGLSGNNVYAVMEDKQGTIWFATDSGITKYYQNNYSYLSLKDGLPSGNIRSLLQDHEGNMWFGTYDAGLVKYNVSGKSFTHYTTADGLPDNFIKVIYEDSENALWLGTFGGGLCKITDAGKTSSSVFKTFTTREGLSNNKVLSILQDREKNLWFGTYIGLNQYRSEVFQMFGLQEGLKNNLVWSVVQNKDADFWLGTEGGLIKYTQADKTFVAHTDKKDFPINNITCVFEDKEGYIWFSAWGEGVGRMDPLGKKAEKFTVKNGLPSQYIFSITSDKDGNILFGTNKNGISKFNPASKKFESYTTDKMLDNKRIFTMFNDSKGNLWLGTLGDYLIKYDGKTFRTYNENDGLNYAFVLCITEDKQGNLWFGTYGGGLFKYDGKTFRNYDITDGLSSDTPYLLTCDDEGNLWTGTGSGIDKMDIFAEKFYHYGKEEGFSGIEINPNAVCKDKAGNIWFGSINGLLKYDARKDNPNIIEPLTQITALKIAFIDTAILQNAVFPYYQNHITFEFAGVSLTNPQKVRYQYKLEGLDKEWSPVTADNYITFPDLQPGEYTFLVKAANNDGVWNKEPVKYHFFITPPFWKTTWFYVLCVVFGSVAVYTIIRLRLRAIQKEKEILEQKVKERTAEIARKNVEITEKNVELEKLSIVASETDNAVIIMNAKGVIEWMNAGFTRMNGFTMEEFRQTKGNTLAQVSSNQDITGVIESCIKEKKSVIYDAINIHKNGNRFWVQSTLTPIFDETGKVKKLVLIDANITDLKRAEQEIKQKNKDIIDSIVYAKRIQQAILPIKEEIKRQLPQSFILYKPRDIVSGDFYWFSTHHDDKVLIAAVDCTGHGVPGAFMSMIGNDVLNHVVKVKGVTQPAIVLDNLNHGVRSALKQDLQDAETRDGMDIAFCLIDKKNNLLEFSGAMRPMYLFRNGNLEIIKADKYPIGGLTTDSPELFTNHVLKIQKGDTVYLFSDGYIDQFGGDKGKKFMARRLQDTLINIQHLNMFEQEKELNRIFEEWKGNMEQIDDVLIIGIRF